MNSERAFSPTRYGFNFQWITSWAEGNQPSPPDRRALEFLARHGFNFVRIPCDYRFWTRDFDYLHPDESVFDVLAEYLGACSEFDLHLSLNLHRVPGYCINGNDLERHNLWLEPEPQEGLAYQWARLAGLFKGIPSERLSFDLINEPPDIGQYGMSRPNHEAVVRKACRAIWEVDPERAIVIDGLEGGNVSVPELSDLDLVHSTRGYQPMTVSHYRADWWVGSKGMPSPAYPGSEWEGRMWDREAIREFYQPWTAIARGGRKVHIGEFGCYDKTPQDVAMRWLSDLFGVLQELGLGYAMWNFEGPFGIIGHQRPGARFECVDGFEVDRELLDLMICSRSG